MLWMLLLATLSVFAAEPPVPPSQAEDKPLVRLALRGVMESWDDPSIATVYRSGVLAGGIGAAVPIYRGFGVDLEIAYRRVTEKSGDDASTALPRLELLPFSLLFAGAFPVGDSAQLFVGAGPTLTTFTEHFTADESTPAGVVRGMKLGGEARFGVRIDTGLVTRPMPPARGGVMKALEVEVYLGRRFQYGTTGFLLSAWRGSAGLVMVF